MTVYRTSVQSMRTVCNCKTASL